MLWTPQTIPWLLVATALFVLAAVVFSRQRASRVAVLFCAMIVLVAVWFASFAAMFLSRDADVAVRWGRLGLAGVALLPAAIYDFTTTALRLYSKRQHIVRVVWVVASLTSGCRRGRDVGGVACRVGGARVAPTRALAPSAGPPSP